MSATVAQAASARMSVQDRDGDWLLAVPLQEDLRDGLASRASAFSQRGPLSVFFDGLLFEREDFARALSMPNDAPAADVIAAGCERDGEDFLARLRGSFVVALEDSNRGRTIVTRDPL